MVLGFLVEMGFLIVAMLLIRYLVLVSNATYACTLLLCVACAHVRATINHLMLLTGMLIMKSANPGALFIVGGRVVVKSHILPSQMQPLMVHQ